MKNQNYLNSQIIYSMSITSLIMGLTLSSYYFVNSLPIAIIGTFDIHLLFFIFGLIMIDKKSFKLFFFFSIPFLTIFNTNILSINHIQVFIEYFLVYYSFFIFLFFNKIGKRWSYIVFIVMLISSFFLRLMLHTISGIIWWGAPNIITSLAINVRIIFMDWICIIPIMIITFPNLMVFKKNTST